MRQLTAFGPTGLQSINELTKCLRLMLLTSERGGLIHQESER